MTKTPLAVVGAAALAIALVPARNKEEAKPSAASASASAPAPLPSAAPAPPPLNNDAKVTRYKDENAIANVTASIAQPTAIVLTAAPKWSARYARVL